jgi:hypothetical protein
MRSLLLRRRGHKRVQGVRNPVLALLLSFDVIPACPESGFYLFIGKATTIPDKPE